MVRTIYLATLSIWLLPDSMPSGPGAVLGILVQSALSSGSVNGLSRTSSGSVSKSLAAWTSSNRFCCASCLAGGEGSGVCRCAK